MNTPASDKDRLDPYTEVLLVFKRFPKYTFEGSQDIHLFLPHEAQLALSLDSIRRQLKRLLKAQEILVDAKGRYKRKSPPAPSVPPPAEGQETER